MNKVIAWVIILFVLYVLYRYVEDDKYKNEYDRQRRYRDVYVPVSDLPPTKRQVERGCIGTNNLLKDCWANEAHVGAVPFDRLEQDPRACARLACEYANIEQHPECAAFTNLNYNSSFNNNKNFK